MCVCVHVRTTAYHLTDLVSTRPGAPTPVNPPAESKMHAERCAATPGQKREKKDNFPRLPCEEMPVTRGAPAAALSRLASGPCALTLGYG